MLKIDQKSKPSQDGQAAIELAVFGAILIFFLGTIVRSAAGNSYAQNQNFKAMRMAMLRFLAGSELEICHVIALQFFSLKTGFPGF